MALALKTFRSRVYNSRWWQLKYFWNVHPYLGKIPIWNNIFQMGWNHQLVINCPGIRNHILDGCYQLAITNPNWKLTVHSGWRFGIYGIPRYPAIPIRWRKMTGNPRVPLGWSDFDAKIILSEQIAWTWLEWKQRMFFFPGVVPYVCRQCARDKVTQNINSCSLRKNPMTLPQIKVHNLQYLSICNWIFIGFVFCLPSSSL